MLIVDLGTVSMLKDTNADPRLPISCSDECDCSKVADDDQVDAGLKREQFHGKFIMVTGVIKETLLIRSISFKSPLCLRLGLHRLQMHPHARRPLLSRASQRRTNRPHWRDIKILTNQLDFVMLMF